MEVTRQSASATVTVNVNRNLNAPVFMGSYERTLDENSLLGTSVVQLMANDSDVNVSSLFLFTSCNLFLFLICGFENSTRGVCVYARALCSSFCLCCPAPTIYSCCYIMFVPSSISMVLCFIDL